MVLQQFQLYSLDHPHFFNGVEDQLAVEGTDLVRGRGLCHGHQSAKNIHSLSREECNY